MKYPTIAIFLSLFLTSANVYAAGIQVSPAKLDFAISNGRLASQDIVVANPTADVQLFEIHADSLGQTITANPASFTLESGARRTVKITVLPENLGRQDSGLYSDFLSIVSRPLADARLEVGTGVKLAVNITTAQTTNNKIPLPWTIGIVALAAVALSLWFFKRRKGQTA